MYLLPFFSLYISETDQLRETACWRLFNLLPDRYRGKSDRRVYFAKICAQQLFLFQFDKPNFGKGLSTYHCCLYLSYTPDIPCLEAISNRYTV